MIPLRVLIQMLLQGSGKVAIFTLIGISVMQGFEMLVQIVPPCEVFVTYPTTQHILRFPCSVNIMFVISQIVFPCETFSTNSTRVHGTRLDSSTWVLKLDRNRRQRHSISEATIHNLKGSKIITVD